MYLPFLNSPNFLQIWSFECLSPLHELRGHKGCVRCSVFSVDSTLLATGDDNGEIRVGAGWQDGSAWASPLHHSGGLWKCDREAQSLRVWLDQAFFVLPLVHVVFQICILELEGSISCVYEEAHALVTCSWFSAVSLRVSHLSSWI